MAMERAWRWFGDNDSISLKDLQEIGVEGIVTALHHLPNGCVWTTDEIMKVKRRIEAHGMRWSVVESLPVAEGIKCGSSDAEGLILNYKRSLQNLASCGIDTVCYNFMPVLDWARTDLHFLTERGESMYFDYATFAAFDLFLLQRREAENDYPKVIVEKAKRIAERLSLSEKENLCYNIIIATQGFINGAIEGEPSDYKELFLRFIDAYKGIDADVLRSNLSFFLHEVIPCAEECGIRMCIHPDDPPFPVLGLPRIASSLDDFKWICKQVDSLSNGITFCTGSLSVRSDNDLNVFIRELGDRIHFVHLRNTVMTDARSFYESGHLTGGIDMFSIVKALLEEQQRRIACGRSDFRLPFRPDHGLKILDDHSHTFHPGYPLVGRLKGLSEITGLQEGIERMLLNDY